jgi:glucokinase
MAEATTTRQLYLAGDVGGTKTILALFPSDGDIRKPIAERTFRSKEYDDLQNMTREFLADVEEPVHKATFGVAGPVVEGRAEITNLSWVLSEEALAESLGLERVRLVNDLVAIANAIPALGTEDVREIKAGAPVRHGSIAVVAPGTGLGEAYLTWDGADYRPFPSEGGHTDFAPTSKEQLDLLHFVLAQRDHCSYEQVCSGIGIPNIYRFLHETGRVEESQAIRDELRSSAEPTRVIIDYFMDHRGECAICDRTMELFISILGAEAGNMALTVLAAGGVYLGGGIPARLGAALATDAFMSNFAGKGRLGDVLTDIPVYTITNPKVALIGAARYAMAS